jgi:hypothetical protein
MSETTFHTHTEPQSRIEHVVKYEERKASATERHGGLLLITVVIDDERKALAKRDGCRNHNLSLPLYTVELSLLGCPFTHAQFCLDAYSVPKGVF